MKQILFCIFLSVTGVVFSQNKSELAESNVKKAVKLIDEGFPDEAIALLQEAKKHDKDNYIYDYEIGYAYFLKEDYKSSLSFYEKAVKFKNSNDQCFQMLGNLLDVSGKPDEAIKIYDKGLKKFPKSGRLFLEKGNVFWNQKKYLEAIRFYEDGIAAEPRFPSNYYRATLIYCNSAEPVWGMIYGEIFMNLEKNSKRTAEISKMLYETYKNQIQILGDTVKVSFSKMNTVNSSGIKDTLFAQMPFGTGVYEPVLLISIGKISAVNMNTLDSIRSNFVNIYYQNDFSRIYRNVLFEYQKKIMANGHFEAYNHWVLMKGDEELFKQWENKNQEKWQSFISWFSANPILLDERNYFHRIQYN